MHHETVRATSGGNRRDPRTLIAGKQFGAPNTAATRAMQQQSQPDPRLSFLLRAACRFDLVELGELELGEAFDGLIPSFEAILARGMA
jgi:hypothetical protein